MKVVIEIEVFLFVFASDGSLLKRVGHSFILSQVDHLWVLGFELEDLAEFIDRVQVLFNRGFTSLAWHILCLLLLLPLLLLLAWGDASLFIDGHRSRANDVLYATGLVVLLGESFLLDFTDLCLGHGLSFLRPLLSDVTSVFLAGLLVEDDISFSLHLFEHFIIVDQVLHIVPIDFLTRISFLEVLTDGEIRVVERCLLQIADLNHLSGVLDVRLVFGSSRHQLVGLHL